jgi:large subunit ribosomal protein L24
VGKKKKQPEPATRAFHIRKGDTVVVLSGDAKGDPGHPRLGRVLAVDKKKWTVTVEKVNLIKRHKKAGGPGKQGGIIEKEAPLHISKVALWDPKAKKGVRVGVRRSKDGKSRERVSRASGDVVGA